MADDSIQSYYDKVLEKELSKIKSKPFTIEDEYIGDWDVISKYHDTKLNPRREAKKLTIVSPKPPEDDGMFTCFDGNRHPQKECLYYDGKYYHTSHTEYIATDCVDGKPILKRRSNKVTVKLKVDNGIYSSIEGMTASYNFDVCIPYVSHKYGFSGRIISEEAIEGWDYKESMSEGMLIDRSRREAHSLETNIHYDSFKNFYAIPEQFDEKTQIKMGIKSPSYQITEGVKYSFGVELEIARGFIPYWKRNRFNISAMRDGSLNGGQGGLEIVTGVLRGDTGLYHLQELCKEISPRTMVDNYCSIHTHIGGLEFSNKFLVNIYLLCQIIEKDMLSIVPPSRRNNQYCKNLKKFDFSPALNIDDLKLKEDYFKLFEWISYEKIQNPTFNYNKTKQHPMGPKCGYNHDTPRYCWLNLVPAIFNTRGDMRWKTLEFRLMEGSTNFEKINNWILLCMAIVKFADKYPENIENTTKINDILMKIYPKKGCQLIEYFDERRRIFSSGSFDEQSWYRNDNKNNKFKTIKELCA